MPLKTHEVRAKAWPKTPTKPISREARAVRTLHSVSAAAERKRPLNQLAQTGAPTGTIDPTLLPREPYVWEPSRTHMMDTTGTGCLGGHELRQPTAPTTRRQPSPIVSTQSSDRNEFDAAFSDIEKDEPLIQINRVAAEWLKLWLKQKKCLAPSAEELRALEVITKSSSYEIMTWLTAHGSHLNDKDIPTNGNSLDPAGFRCRVSKSHRSKVEDPNAPDHVYECTNGCETRFSKFKRHEWIRHEEENIEVWGCRLCPRVLTRKDKLRDHLRNIHHEEISDLEAWRKEFRAPQQRPCGFCKHVFEDSKSWLSHVGAHFEGRLPGGVKKMSDWYETRLSTHTEPAQTDTFDDPSNMYNTENVDEFGDISNELFNGFQGFGPPNTSRSGFHVLQDEQKQATPAPENPTGVEKPLATDNEHDLTQPIAPSYTPQNPPPEPRHGDFNENFELDLIPSMAALSISPTLQTFRIDDQKWADYPPPHPSTASSDEEEAWSQYTCGSSAEFLRTSPQGGGSGSVPIDSLPGAVRPKRRPRELRLVPLRRYEAEPLHAGPYFAGQWRFSEQRSGHDQGWVAEFDTGTRL